LRSRSAASRASAATSGPSTATASSAATLRKNNWRRGAGDQHHENHRGRQFQDAPSRITLLLSVRARKSLCSVLPSVAAVPCSAGVHDLCAVLIQFARHAIKYLIQTNGTNQKRSEASDVDVSIGESLLENGNI
jgi:hypothetical protein